MKIRSSFVSNSSSASYTLTIRGIEEDEFYEQIISEFWLGPWIDALKERIKDEIKDVKENGDHPWGKPAEKRLEKIVEAKKAIESDDRILQLKCVLDWNRITIEHKYGRVINVKEWTSMHNDYDTGMGKMMKEISLFFLFEKAGYYDIRAETIHDGR